MFNLKDIFESILGGGIAGAVKASGAISDGGKANEAQPRFSGRDVALSAGRSMAYRPELLERREKRQPMQGFGRNFDRKAGVESFQPQAYSNMRLTGLQPGGTMNPGAFRQQMPTHGGYLQSGGVPTLGGRFMEDSYNNMHELSDPNMNYGLRVR